MPVMTGNIVTAGERPLGDLAPRVLWYLNKGTRHGSTIIVDEPAVAAVNGTRFSVNVAVTGPGEWYTVVAQWLDGDGQVLRSLVLDEQVQVPERGGELGGGTGDWITPDSVVISLEEPETPTPFWLQAAIGDPDPGTSTGSGDLYRRVD